MRKTQPWNSPQDHLSCQISWAVQQPSYDTHSYQSKNVCLTCSSPFPMSFVLTNSQRETDRPCVNTPSSFLLCCACLGCCKRNRNGEGVRLQRGSEEHSGSAPKVGVSSEGGSIRRKWSQLCGSQYGNPRLEHITALLCAPLKSPLPLQVTLSNRSYWQRWWIKARPYPFCLHFTSFDLIWFLEKMSQ